MILMIHTELSNNLFKYKADDIRLKHELYDLFEFLDADYAQKTRVANDKIRDLKLKMSDSFFKSKRYQDELLNVERELQDQTQKYNKEQELLLVEYIKAHYIIKSVIRYELNTIEAIYMYDLEKLESSSPKTK